MIAAVEEEQEEGVELPEEVPEVDEVALGEAEAVRKVGHLTPLYQHISKNGHPQEAQRP